MYPFATQTLIRDHIREARQQAAAARRGNAARGEQRKAVRPYRRSHRVVREA